MYEFLRYRVRDAMTSTPVTVGPDARLRELEGLFATHDFNGIPVVDAEQRLLGIVTKLDLLKAFALSPRTLVPRYEEIMERTAESVMTAEPVTVDPDLPLSRLLQRMVEMRIKSFPVLQGDRLVGIVSREDVLKALRRATGHLPPSQEARS